MKIKGLIIILIFISGTLKSQISISNNTLNDLSFLSKELNRTKQIPSEELMSQFPIYKIGNTFYLSIVLSVNKGFNNKELEQYQALIGSRINNIVSVKFPIAKLDESLKLKNVDQLHIAGKIKPSLDRAIGDVRADSVQKGIGLPEAYTGKDVLIGITDWGFDYTSPMFYDTLLNQSRILAAWDQYKLSGPAPSGYGYGTEYSTVNDLIAAGSDTANIYSYSTHGNHVAGIAGGSGAGTIYRGAAFQSQFLFTTFLVDESSVLDAWQWMYNKAQAEGKRLVVNMSWGLYHMQALDGTSLLSQAIDAYSDLGVIFVTSGGNNGDVAFHIAKDFSTDTLLTRINFYTSANLSTLWGQSIHIWGEPGNSFSAGIKILNNSNQTLNETEWYSTVTTSSYIDTFLVSGIDTVWYNISADLAYPTNGRPQMRLRVRNTNSSLRVVLKAQASSGKVHFWNVTELTSDVGNWGMPFTTLGVGYTAGDKNYGIGTPACTQSVISVAAHYPEYYNAGGFLTGGTMANFSSFGPTMDERLKPDISAPGGSIASSISSFTDASFTSIASINFNSRTYHFAKFSGTSMSSPMTAGVCALILDANPYLSSQQVKDIIIQTAREDSKTGDIPVSGDTRWGWGKLDAYAAVQLALNTTGFTEINKPVQWQVYPNPSSEILTVKGIEASLENVTIVNMNGDIVSASIEGSDIDISFLPNGSYILRALINGKVEQIKFIKQ